MLIFDIFYTKKYIFIIKQDVKIIVFISKSPQEMMGCILYYNTSIKTQKYLYNLCFFWNYTIIIDIWGIIWM